MTRYKTYELEPGVFGTYDSQTETLPTVFLSGPYDVNLSEAEEIVDGAWLGVVDGELVIADPTIFHAAPGSLLPEVQI